MDFLISICLSIGPSCCPDSLQDGPTTGQLDVGMSAMTCVFPARHLAFHQARKTSGPLSNHPSVLPSGWHGNRPFPAFFFLSLAKGRRLTEKTHCSPRATSHSRDSVPWRSSGAWCTTVARSRCLIAGRVWRPHSVIDDFRRPWYGCGVIHPEEFVCPAAGRRPPRPLKHR